MEGMRALAAERAAPSIERALETRTVEAAGKEGTASTAPLDELLGELDLLLAAAEADGEAHALLAAARNRARNVGTAAGNGREGRVLAAFGFLGEVASGLAVADRTLVSSVADVVDDAAGLLGIPRDVARTAAYLAAIRDAGLLALPPALAIDAHLTLFCAFASATGASLWAPDEFQRLTCLGTAGEEASPRRATSIAGEAIASASASEATDRRLFAMPVSAWERPFAALVGVGTSADALERALALAAEAARSLAPLLERDALLRRNAARERSLVEASERRLSRVGFDLHDGAMQDVLALAADVKLFGRQLAGSLGAAASMPLLARLEDLESRVHEIDRELRELTHSLESPVALKKPLAQVLEAEVDAFARETQVATELDVSDGGRALTASQEIALVRIVQEALANVREHSGATEVRVSVGVRRGFVQAAVTDNGCGFDVERTLVRAAKSGRLGLLGMSERVRLLGGRFDVESRPGGPTTIAVSLALWEPSQAAAERPRSQIVG